MRLVSFERDGRARLGSWIEGDTLIVDLEAAAEATGLPGVERYGSMLSLIEAGQSAWDEARSLTQRAPEECLLGSNGIRLRAPLPVPPQIRDFLCFEQHLINSSAAALTILSRQALDPAARRRELEASGQWKIPDVWYTKPYYYTSSRFAVSGPDDEIKWPAYSKMIDYELEFAAVIGKPGIDIPAERAREHIFGYTIFNDWSARDEQAIVMEGRLGPGKGKDFDRSNSFGPCIVTADELGDPYGLTMVARVDGVEWSRGSSAAMHHRFEDCIAEASRGQTIHPGEVFGSGTVGTGCGVENLKFLQGGEIVELEVDRIGILRNRVVR